MVTVEATLWMSFLVGMSIMVGQQVVTPLVANAQHQAELNQESLVIIDRALATCAVTQ